MRRRRTILWLTLLAGGGLVGIYLGGESLLRGVGQWLDVGVAPEPADYVMPLGGDENIRPFAAAKLIRADKASKAIIADIRPTADAEAGLTPSTHTMMRRVLVHYGTAAEDIVTIGKACNSTYDEAQALAGFLEHRPTTRVIVITGHYHTRRTRWAFNRVLADRAGQVSFASAPAHTFRLSTWWQNEKGAELVVGEYLKLAYYSYRFGWAGYWTAICLVLLWIAWRYRKNRRKRPPLM